jgi:SAM-dependent methyltransferase
MRFRTDRIELRVQYRDSTNLADRVRLHRDFSTSTIPWIEWLAARLVPPAGAAVLEVGCGPGGLWASSGLHLDRRLSLVLTDLSPGMAAEARDRLGAGVRCLCADAQDLPFADAAFDAVVSCHMIYHVPDPVRAARAFRLVLRPGGRLYLATNGADHLRELWETLGQVTGDPSPTPHSLGPLEATQGWLMEVFADVTLERFDDSLVVTELEPLLAYARSTQRLDADQLARLADRWRADLRRGPIRIRKESALFVAAGTAGA